MMLRKVLVCLLFVPFLGQAQLVVNNTLTATDLVQNVLLGSGVTATNVTFNGLPGNAVYVQAGQFDASSSSVGVPLGGVGLTDGILLASGDLNVPWWPNDNFGLTSPVGGLQLPGDPDLTTLTGFNNASYDAAVLEFDFVPQGDTLRFRYVFASEEYLTFVGSTFNDAFGFFLSGPGIFGPFSNNAVNLALVPGTTTPVSINTVNPGSNPAYYVDNGDGSTNPWLTDPMATQFNGGTVIMEAFALVQCGQQYHIKLAIGDGGGAAFPDYAYDSGVFLEAGSFSSSSQVSASLGSGLGIINDSLIMESCSPVELVFGRTGDTSGTDIIPITVGGTATPGVDYTPALPNQITFLPGDTLVTLTITVPIDADLNETIDITLTQAATCGGLPQQVTTTFYIQDPPPVIITAADTNIICNQTVTIGASATGGFGSYTYSWNTGATTDSITVSPSVTTDYIVTVMDTCGFGPFVDTVTVTLPVYAPLQLQLSNDTAINCLTTADLNVVSLTGGDGNYVGSWLDSAGNVLSPVSPLNVPAGNPTYYYYAAVDGCGSFIVDSVLVTTAVLAPIQITTADTLSPVCPGDTVTLDVMNVTGGNGVYSYQWSLGGSVIASTASTDIGVNVDLTYVVQVDDQCGYTGFDSIHTVLPVYDPMTLEVAPSEIICLGDSVDLYAWVDGGSGVYTVVWPTVFDAAGDPVTDPTVTVTPADALTYYPVVVYDQCGIGLGDSTLIVAEFIDTDIVLTQPGQDDVTLFAASEPLGSTFTWDMGDGTRYRGENVAHSYLTIDSTFVVSLVVTTLNGCVDTSFVLVEPPAHVYFPNAFSPDGDGINDFWTPVGHDLDILELRIFNRWGEEVFSSFSAESFVWDGRVNGDGLAKPDVYVYWYRAAGHLLPNFEGYGHITLVR